MKVLRTIARVFAIVALAIGLGAAVTDGIAGSRGNPGWPPGGPGGGGGGP